VLKLRPAPIARRSWCGVGKLKLSSYLDVARQYHRAAITSQIARVLGE
jgi:hypothetical protein